MLSFLDLRDLFTVQGLSVQMQAYVNPASEQLQVDYQEWFGLETQRPIRCYGSILFILQENDYLAYRADLEQRIRVRNEQEALAIAQYEQRISELQEELDLDYQTFATKFIAKLRKEVAQN